MTERWRKSSSTDGLGEFDEAVLVRRLPDGDIVLMDVDTQHVLVYTPAEFAAFVDGVKRGEFDDLVGGGSGG